MTAVYPGTGFDQPPGIGRFKPGLMQVRQPVLWTGHGRQRYLLPARCQGKNSIALRFKADILQEYFNVMLYRALMDRYCGSLRYISGMG
ncbi:MAG: hypothetical protein B6I22_09920 [Desulfobacteraceae bacterium 4572_123]|nr:MAG: hypothetical protein B6I22_09920 [Desulfobacteraceae bacterium 4572_123]